MFSLSLSRPPPLLTDVHTLCNFILVHTFYILLNLGVHYESLSVYDFLKYNFNHIILCFMIIPKLTSSLDA